ncbi:MAG: CYTH domain-containing protein, partial [Pseudomonadota bacterium]
VYTCAVASQDDKQREYFIIEYDQKILSKLNAVHDLVHVTDFARTTWQLSGPDDTKIELCLDLGEVKTDSANLPIQEIELELKQGDASHIYQVALDLLDAGIGLRLENKSKAQRGYSLHHPEKVQAVAYELPELKPQDMLQDALPRLVQQCIETLQDNEDAVILNRDAQAIQHVFNSLEHLEFSLSLCAKFDTRADSSLQSLQAFQQTTSPTNIVDNLQSPTYTRMILSLSHWLYLASTH